MQPEPEIEIWDKEAREEKKNGMVATGTESHNETEQSCPFTNSLITDEMQGEVYTSRTDEQVERKNFGYRQPPEVER